MTALGAPAIYVPRPMPPFVRLWGAGTIWGGVCGIAAAYVVALFLLISHLSRPSSIGEVVVGLFVVSYLYGTCGCLVGAVLGTATGSVAGLVFVALRGCVRASWITPATVAIVVVIQIAVGTWAFGPDLLWIGLAFPVIAVGPMWWAVLKVARASADDTMDA